MKNFLFIAVIILSSCSTQQRCARLYPQQIKDSVFQWVSTETYCDSFKIPYQELVFDTTADEIPKSLVIHHSQTKGHLTQTLNIKNGKITQRCVSDSLTEYIEFQRKTFHEKELRLQTQMIPCDKKHHTGWDSFCNYFTVISVSLLFIWYIVKVCRIYFMV